MRSTDFLSRFLPWIILSYFIFTTETGAQMSVDPTNPEGNKWVLVIHGGAGVILPGNISEEREQHIKDALNEALKEGGSILENGGSAMDAVTRAVTILEDDPNFNAGKGSVFTHEGTNEMDASIMDGSNLEAGAVSGVRRIRNPILAARAVLEKSKHVMLSGDGADEFAKDQGIEWVEPEYFYTERRFKSLERVKEKESKHGTVGAVALDMYGNLASATSTGGMTNKKYNRIGDSPIIGAGTYANNETCAVSCTGHGEYFMRYAVAYDLSARMIYGKLSLKDAASEIIQGVLKKAGGEGGLIAVDKDGNYVMEFNSAGMYRGVAVPGLSTIALYKE
jgi:beta-aspartyl-peptidase (threonine type)